MADTDLLFSIVARDEYADKLENARALVDKITDSEQQNLAAAQGMEKADRDLAGATDRVNESSATWTDTLSGLNQGLELVKKGIEGAKAVWNFAKEGAEIQRIGDQFAATVETIGGSADAWAEAINRATGNTVDDEALMQEASRAMTQGIITDQKEMVDAIEIARATAIRFGGDTISNFDRLVQSADMLSTRGFKQLGIVGLDAKKILDDYAKAHGTTADKVDEDTQKHILFLAALDKGKDIVKAVGTSVNDELSSLQKVEKGYDDASESVKQFAAKTLVEFIDDMSFSNTLLDQNITFEEKLAIATRLNSSETSGWHGQLTVTVEKLKEFVNANNESDGAVRSLARSQAEARSAEASGLASASSAQDRYYAALAASAEAQQRSEDATRRNTEAMAAQEKVAQDDAIGFRSLSESLVKAKDADVAKLALSGLEEQMRSGKITSDQYRYAVRETELQYGLATKASIVQADALDMLNQKYAEGKVSPEEYSTAVGKIKSLAGDTVTTLADLGIKSAQTTHKTRQEIQDELADMTSKVMGGVNQTVDQSMRAVSNASSAAKGLVNDVGNSIANLPRRTDLDIYIHTHGDVPNIPSGGAGGGHQSGINMIIPPNFPNDTFPLGYARSGEQFIVRTPEQQAANAGAGQVVNNYETVNLYDTLVTRQFAEQRRIENLKSLVGNM